MGRDKFTFLGNWAWTVLYLCQCAVSLYHSYYVANFKKSQSIRNLSPYLCTTYSRHQYACFHWTQAAYNTQDERKQNGDIMLDILSYSQYHTRFSVNLWAVFSNFYYRSHMELCLKISNCTKNKTYLIQRVLLFGMERWIYTLLEICSVELLI